MRLLVQGVGQRFRRDFDRAVGAGRGPPRPARGDRREGYRPPRDRGHAGGVKPVHIARIETRSLDETAEAVDLGQSPAEIVMLSFTDSDLAAFAAAWERMREPRPSLRLANLAALKHPYSVDLYLEKVCSSARFVLGAAARRHGVLALRRRRTGRSRQVPWHRARAAARRSLRGRAARGGLDAGSALRCGCWKAISRRAAPTTWPRASRSSDAESARRALWRRSASTRRAILPSPALAGAGAAKPTDGGRRNPHAPHPNPLPRRAGEGARALIVFYRSIYLADDLAPIDALADALEARGFAVTCAYVTSLKDAAARAPLSALISPRKVRRHPQRHRLFRAPRPRRRRRSRPGGRAGASGRAGRSGGGGHGRPRRAGFRPPTSR